MPQNKKQHISYSNTARNVVTSKCTPFMIHVGVFL